MILSGVNLRCQRNLDSELIQSQLILCEELRQENYVSLSGEQPCRGLRKIPGNIIPTKGGVMFEEIFFFGDDDEEEEILEEVPDDFKY